MEIFVAAVDAAVSESAVVSALGLKPVASTRSVLPSPLKSPGRKNEVVVVTG